MAAPGQSDFELILRGVEYGSIDEHGNEICISFVMECFAILIYVLRAFAA